MHVTRIEEYTANNQTYATILASDKIKPSPPEGSVFVAGWHPTAAVAVPLTMIPELQGAGFRR